MKYFITTAIPYVNADLHVGNALDYVMADVLARRARLNNEKVVFSTGTDEHGAKIAEKAKDAGLSVESFVGEMSDKVKDLFGLMDISYDRFTRTTDQSHEKRAQAVWKILGQDIYKSKYTGWYCVGDEEFFTETVVSQNNGICPDHNRPYERVEEENYFFRLSKYNDQIKQAITSNTFKIVPAIRRNEILSLLNEGLEDISISRPLDKVSWGIPVPGDEKQVMYVWFEALLNYLSVIGYPDSAEYKEYWPADVQIIGKGILRFHAGIWPGILLALDLPLPKTLFVHGYCTINGQKISKTLGNVILPADIIKSHGTDAFRYYLLRHVPSYDDGDFSWEAFEEAYNNELANELGNALQRTVAMILRYSEGVIKELPKVNTPAGYDDALDDFHFDRALTIIWEEVRELNQYIDIQKPWIIAKNDDHQKLQEVLSHQAASLLNIARLLEPFLPQTSHKIIESLSSGRVKLITGTLFPKT